jgi:hypothetical protein
MYACAGRAIGGKLHRNMSLMNTSGATLLNGIRNLSCAQFSGIGAAVCVKIVVQCLDKSSTRQIETPIRGWRPSCAGTTLRML